MPQKPVVAYRDPTTPEVVQSALPDGMLPVIVFGVGVILFALIAISYKW